MGALALRLNNIQFSLLSANPSMLSELTSKVERVIARKAGEGVLPEHVNLDVKPGSVIISVSISTRSMSADTVQKNLDDRQMLQDIASEVNAVVGIGTATTGTVSATFVRAPTVQSRPATAPAEGESKLSFVIGSVAGGVAMLSLMSVSCFLYRHVSQSGSKDTQPQQDIIGKEFQL